MFMVHFDELCREKTVFYYILSMLQSSRFKIIALPEHYCQISKDKE